MSTGGQSAESAQTTGCVADPEGPCFKVDWLCDWCRTSVSNSPARSEVDQ